MWQMIRMLTYIHDILHYWYDFHCSDSTTCTALYYIQRKFIREVDEGCTINYSTFRVWINSNFGEISEEVWVRLLSEDEEFAYHVESEALVSTERVIVDPYVDNAMPMGDIEIQSGTGEDDSY